MGLGSGLKKIKILINIFSLEKVTIMQLSENRGSALIRSDEAPKQL